MKKITKINVDDYIRDAKRLGVKEFFWSGEGLKCFRYFARNVFNFEGYRLPHSFPKGDIFLGVKHFKI